MTCDLRRPRGGTAPIALLAIGLLVFGQLGCPDGTVAPEDQPAAGSTRPGTLYQTNPLASSGDEELVVATVGMPIFAGNTYPTRLTSGPEGMLAVTDARANSVFLYDANRQMIGELAISGRPLGVALDYDKRLFVGNHDTGRVEVYGAHGQLEMEFGAGQIQMPNDLALDHDGNVYVADSTADTVRVYNPDGTWLRDIGHTGDGDADLRFPAAVTVAYRQDNQGQGELYVADQSHSRISVFDLLGNHLRVFGEPVEAFGNEWEGRFVKPQSVSMDDRDRLLVADSYLNRIQILDPVSGEFLTSVGEYGARLGQLDLPLDIVAMGEDVVIANTENQRVEVIHDLP